MTCPRCQQDNPVAGAQFCPRCGAPAEQAAQEATPTVSYSDLQRQLTEALERQTATSEILRVISQSQTDVQPVFDTLARSARELCNGEYCIVESFDGEHLHFGASDGLSLEGLAAFQQALPRPVSEDNAAGRAVLRRTVVQIPDVHADAAHGVKDVALAANYRSVVAAPIMRDRQPIGAIVVARSPVGFFPDRQVELLKTFADQAVIAIENVRLFKELEARNRDLTATSDILQVISSSPTDVQPVFEAIADSGMRLFDAQGVTVVRYDGELISIAAARGGALGSAAADIERFRAPHRPIAGFPPEQAVLTKTMHHVTDVAADLVCSEEFRRHARQRGFRSVLAVPLLRGGDPVGAIVVSRAQAGPFSTAEIELVHTFADQAVIAIENARLFNETKEALEQQTAA